MQGGRYLNTAHSEAERDRMVKDFEKALKKNKLPGKIEVEFRRVKYTHQWDIYHVVD
jgi:hypothetical protein